MSTPPSSEPTTETHRPSVGLWWLAPCAGIALLLCAVGLLAVRNQTLQTQNVLLDDAGRLTGLQLRSVEQRAEAERLLAARLNSDARRRIGELTTQLELVRQELADETQRNTETSRQLLQHQADLTEVHARLAQAEMLLADSRERVQSGAILPRLRLIALAPVPPATSPATATVAWDPETGEGVLRAAHLPTPDPGQACHLWLLAPAAAAPVDLGRLEPAPADGAAVLHFRTDADNAGGVRFAIGLGPQDRVPAGDTPFLLSGE